jgi:F-type H+-transporting ATPase subunit delta
MSISKHFKLKLEAKRYLKLSFDSSGFICPEKVSAIIEHIKRSYEPSRAVRLMKLYLKCMLVETRQSVGVLYATHAPSDSDLQIFKNYFSQLLKRSITLTVVLDPQLLGGYRVAIGDYVWDVSIKGRIEALSSYLLY